MVHLDDQREPQSRSRARIGPRHAAGYLKQASLHGLNGFDPTLPGFNIASTNTTFGKDGRWSASRCGSTGAGTEAGDAARLRPEAAVHVLSDGDQNSGISNGRKPAPSSWPCGR
jgi:hypothetical protein